MVLHGIPRMKTGRKYSWEKRRCIFKNSAEQDSFKGKRRLSRFLVPPLGGAAQAEDAKLLQKIMPGTSQCIRSEI